MAACEKRWADSRGSDTHGDGYKRLLDERRDSPCTPEEQAGPGATACQTCGRMTMHQHARDVCMAGCGKPDAGRGGGNG